MVLGLTVNYFCGTIIGTSKSTVVTFSATPIHLNGVPISKLLDPAYPLAMGLYFGCTGINRINLKTEHCNIVILVEECLIQPLSTQTPPCLQKLVFF